MRKSRTRSPPTSRRLERLKAKRQQKRQEKLDEQRERILREANEKAHAILREAKETADETIRNFHKFGKENISAAEHGDGAGEAAQEDGSRRQALA